jgi:hypothetical protein
VKAIPAFVERYRFTTTQNKKVVARCWFKQKYY